jgi:hypothetical protein
VRPIPLGLRCGLALLALLFLRAAPARADTPPRIRLEAGASASLIAGGASNAYLRPGTQRPDATFLLSPRPFVGLRTRRLGVHLAYAPALQRSLASGVTGQLHDGRLALRASVSRTLVLDGLLSASYASYAGAGAPDEEGTLDLIATRTTSAGAGTGLLWRPDGPFSLRTAFYMTRRHSQAVTRSDEPPQPVDDYRFEGTLAAAWQLSSAVGIWAGPLAEVREANRVRLSYWGFGVELGGQSRLWSSGGLDASVRAQRNTFGGLFPRDDLFARIRLALWQDVGDHARISLRYAYTANGSALAAYDADRHLLVAALAVRTPTWRR